jgi:hypothetical protein
MSRTQIAERLDAGDHAGAVRLAAREKIANLKKAQRSGREMQLAALEELVRRNPEINTEFMGGQLRQSLAALGLKGTTIEDMERALHHVQETLAPVAEYEARRQMRPRQEVTAPPAVATAQPEPEDDSLTAEAKQLIAQGRVSRESIAQMTALQYERAISSPVFNKCLELLEPRRDPSPLTLGELKEAHGHAHRMNQQGHTVITADVVRAVEESKRTHWTSVYQDPSAPSAPYSASRGIVNLNRAMHIPNKRQPTMKEVISQEQKDQKFLEEQRAKSARALRVRANRGKA